MDKNYERFVKFTAKILEMYGREILIELEEEKRVGKVEKADEKKEV